MIHPSFEEYERWAREWPIVPVYREVLADLATPVSVFRRIPSVGDVALLESVEGGETWGRFSMIGFDPATRYERRAGVVTIRDGDGMRREPKPEQEPESEPLAALDAVLSTHRTAPIARLPRLAGAAIGVCAYDLVRDFESLPAFASDDLGFPDALFVLFESAILFDHAGHTATLVAHTRPGSDPRRAYEEGRARIDQLERLLQGDGDGDAAPASAAAAGTTPSVRATPSAAGPPRFHSRTGRAAFLSAVESAKEWIRSGDVVQVVLSHRLEADLAADPFDVYRALRVINPSPYMFFLRLAGWTIAGSSPEVLIRREGDLVQTRPIAGTRARSEDPQADRALEEDLLASEKERAEHVMLVDLGRNDLGRICRYGTVATDQFLAVERYSHVMHLVSHVRGQLREGLSNAQVLRACFPAGTVSGAPKIRAMEIIEDLEPLRRGLYAGAVGYMDYHGNMDLAIAIRTLLFRDGRAYLGVGAGIVADSDPQAEWEETLRKSSACVRACELAARGFEALRSPASPLPDIPPIPGEPAGGSS